MALLVHRNIATTMLALAVLVLSTTPSGAATAEPSRIPSDDTAPSPVPQFADLLEFLGIGSPGSFEGSSEQSWRGEGLSSLSAESDGGTRVPWTPMFPMRRWDPLMAFDTERGDLVLAGGVTPRGFPDDAHMLSPSGQWTRIARGGWPRPRSSAPLVFDPRQKRMLVFGGWFEGPVDGPPGRYCASFDDTYELRLADETGWRPVTVAGERPARRYDHAAVVDESRNRLVVFGGTSLPAGATYCGDTVRLADVWVLPLGPSARWTQLHPAGQAPPAGRAGSAVYDEVGDRMLFVAQSSVWALRFSPDVAWESLPLSGPGPTWAVSSVMDRSEHRLIAVDRESTWTLDLDAPALAWQRLTEFDRPLLSNSSFGAALDPDRNRLLVVDGWPRLQVFEIGLDGPHVWTNADHTFRPDLGGHRAVYDLVRDQMIAVGGFENLDVLAFDLDERPAWSVLARGSGAPDEPGPRAGHALFHDLRRDRLVTFGGVRLREDPDLVTWSLELDGAARWVAHPAPAGSPAVGHGPAAIYDMPRDRVLALKDGDVWELPLSDLEGWRRIETTGSGPGSVFFAAATYDPVRDQFVVLEGFGAHHPPRLWTLDLATLVWRKVNYQGWVVRSDTPLLVYDSLRDRYLLSTGESHGAAFEYWPQSEAWDFLDQHCCGWDTYTHETRVLHAAIYDPARDALIVSGGGPSPHGGAFRDVWALPLGTPGHRAQVLIRSGGASGRAKLGSSGVLTAAILSAPGFDAAKIDPASVDLSGATVRTPGRGHVQVDDADGDGLQDLVLHLEARELDLVPDQSVLVLTARTFGGAPVQGAARLLPSRKRPAAAPAVRTPPAPADLEVTAVTFDRQAGVRAAFRVPEAGPVTLEVFDVAGRRRGTWRGFVHEPGAQRATVGLVDRPRAGVYFLRMRHASSVVTRRIIIVDVP